MLDGKGDQTLINFTRRTVVIIVLSKNNVQVAFFFLWGGEMKWAVMNSIRRKLAFRLYPRPPLNYHISSKLDPMSQLCTRSRTRSHDERVLEDTEFSNG